MNHTGTVREMTWGFAIDDDVNGQRYASGNLPVAYRQDGMRILFSGRTVAVPPNVDPVATPLDLRSIHAITR